MNMQAKGMPIFTGVFAKQYRRIVNECYKQMEYSGFQEIILPAVEPVEIYTEKMGEEILNQMYTFKDKSDRNICLRPEGTATIQKYAQENRMTKEISIYYLTKCWRYEKPQEGRYREFTQFGVEVVNSRHPERVYDIIVDHAMELIETFREEYGIEIEFNPSVKRGLQYYTEDGFEAICPILGAQKQILGGGKYAEGSGFAFGIERIVLAYLKTHKIDF